MADTKPQNDQVNDDPQPARDADTKPTISGYDHESGAFH